MEWIGESGVNEKNPEMAKDIGMRSGLTDKLQEFL